MTVLERAELPVDDDRAEEFEAVLATAAELLLSPGGCRRLTIGRGIERPNVFLVTAAWDSVDHHLAFRETPEFGEFVGAIKPFLVGPTGMEHFAPLIDR